jgi:hypothetical protein
MPDITFSSDEALKPYEGPDVNQKFPGEDDLIWCERCKTHHRGGASWEVERERIIRKAAARIADNIDAAVIERLRDANA